MGSFVPSRMLSISTKGPTCWAQFRGTPPPTVKMPSRLAARTRRV